MTEKEKVEQKTESIQELVAKRREQPPKPFYSKWLFWVVVVVVILAVIGMVGGGEDDTPTVADQTDQNANQKQEEPTETSETAEESEESKVASDSESEPEPEKLPTLNEEVRVGELSYKVTEVEFTKMVGSEYFNKTTENQFLLVKVSVTNHDSEARYVDDTMFTIVDGEGMEYEADGSAAMYVNDDTGFFLENINPNLTKTGYIVFEVPEDISNLKLKCESGFGWAGGESVLIDLGV